MINKSLRKVFLINIVIVLIDQIIKLFCLKINNDIILIKKILYLTKAFNDGAAWSILSGKIWLLILVALISVSIVIYWIKDKELGKLGVLTYGLLLGGIIGNLLDRIFRGYVIDYIGVMILNYQFPIFNFADSCIVIAVIILVLNSKQQLN